MGIVFYIKGKENRYNFILSYSKWQEFCCHLACMVDDDFKKFFNSTSIFVDINDDIVHEKLDAVADNHPEVADLFFDIVGAITNKTIASLYDKIKDSSDYMFDRNINSFIELMLTALDENSSIWWA